ncbi:ABC transporter substrate-binding protein [Leptolyngbya sp. FACHB-1515]|uniref:ABC transporter substrate-binding protein n=1 Tax=Leptolyngbya sp. FACHB-1515 TaxID=2933931 RepID=UPI00329945A2
MKSKLLRYVAIAWAVAIALISCQSATPLDANAVTVKLSGWGASPTEQSLMQQLLQDFEQTHPKIKIRYEVINDQYMDVIKTRLIGDAAPDVFYLDVFQAPFLVSQNVLEPLDSYVGSDFDSADFEAPLLNAFRYENRIYGFPKDFSTLALFYNKTMFAAAGLSRPPETWDELREFSKKLTIDSNKDGRIEQYGFGVAPELARQAMMIRAAGGELANSEGRATFASEKAIVGLQPVIDQYRQDRTSAQKSDVGTNSGSEMFGQGKVAMVIEGNWAIPYLQETFADIEFGTAEVPKLGDRRSNTAFTVAYVMNQQSEHKSEAWQLISYLTSKAGMQRWTSTGFALPTRKSVAKTLGFDRDPLRSAFIAGVPYAQPWQAGAYAETLMNNFDNQFISALLGEQSLSEAMQRAEEAANQQIEAMQ